MRLHWTHTPSSFPELLNAGTEVAPERNCNVLVDNPTTGTAISSAAVDAVVLGADAGTSAVALLLLRAPLRYGPTSELERGVHPRRNQARKIITLR